VSFQGSVSLLLRKCNNIIKEKVRTHRTLLKGFMENIVGFGIKKFKAIIEQLKFKGIIGRKTFQF